MELTGILNPGPGDETRRLSFTLMSILGAAGADSPDGRMESLLLVLSGGPSWSLH